MAFGEQLASVGEKIVFLLPAFGKSIADKRVKDFGKEFVSKEQIDVLKQIYTDPKTYRDALIGAAVIVILGGIRSGKIKSTQVKKIPSSTRKYPARTILRDVNNKLGYVTKSGRVIDVPKGLRTVTRALTRDLKEYNFRNVKAFPKTSTARVGTVYRNTKGETRIVTRGGKVSKLRPNQIRDLQASYKKGTKARSSRTLKARQVREAQIKVGKGIDKKSADILRKLDLKKQIAKIRKETNAISKKYGIKGKTKEQFFKAYRDFKLKGTRKSELQLRRITDKVEVQKGVNIIDNIIKRRLPKKKVTVKSKLKKPSRPKATSKEIIRSEKLQGRIKADSKARAKGFKDYQEEFNYYKIKKAFDTGKKGSVKKMRDFTRKLKARKSKLSKLRSKRIEKQTELLVKEANQLLREGKIKIKTTKFKVIKKRPKMSLDERQRFAISVTARLSKLKQNKLKRQAKEVVKEILRGNEVQINDRALQGTVRNLIERDWLRQLKVDKRLSIRGAKLKTSLSKTARKQIKVNAKKQTTLNRLARKKQKRSPAGDSQARKIFRKQVRTKVSKGIPQKKSISYNSISERIKGNFEVRNPRYRVVKEGSKLVVKNKGTGSNSQARLLTNRLNQKLAREVYASVQSKPVTGIPKGVRRAIKRFETPSTARTSKLLRKQFRAKVLDEIRTIRQIKEGGAVPKNYELVINEFGVKLVPKKGVKIKIKTAKDILKKSKVPKGSVKVNKDGTIQLLKSVTKKETPTKLQALSRKKLLERAYAKLKTKSQIKQVKRAVKVRPKVRKGSLTKVAKLKVIKPKTFATAIALSVGILSKTAKAVPQLSSIKFGMAKATLIKQESLLKKELKLVLSLKQDLASISDTVTDLTTAQASKLDQLQAQASKLAQKTTSVLKTISKLKTKPPKELIKQKLPILPRLPKLNWNTKLPKGYSFIVDARYKKGNKVLNRRLKTTPNRARKVMNKFIDNNPQASYDLVVVGARKVKDIKKPSMKKFTIRKGKDPKVRVNVEKNKYRLDRPKEKSISRLPKRKKRKPAKKRTSKRKK